MSNIEIAKSAKSLHPSAQVGSGKEGGEFPECTGGGKSPNKLHMFSYWATGGVLGETGLGRGGGGAILNCI